MPALRLSHVVAAATLSLSVPAQAAPIVFSGAGPVPLAIQPVVDAFRAALGIDNGALAGTQPGGRREISWDGGGAGAPAALFGNPMTTFAPRGSVFITPGAAFEISGQPFPEFGEINPQYPEIFQPFSEPRLFAPIASNVMDVLFTVPGTVDEAATTRGFGVVFTDVDLAATTSIQFFDAFNVSLGTFYADVFNTGLSFLAVLFDAPIVARARITAGNAALGPFDGGSIDIVAMDDFIYGEPGVVAAPVPEPGVFGLLGFGLLGLAALRRRRA